MAFDATLGGESSNSLISVADATAIAGDLPQTEGIVAWLGLISGDKEKTLVASSLTFQGLRWKGKLCNEKQALCFPRFIDGPSVYATCEKIPYEVLTACVFLAAFIGSSGGYLAIGEEGGPVQTVGTNPFPGLSPDDLAGYEEVELGKGAIRFKLDTKREPQALDFLPPFSMNLISRFVISGSGIQSSSFSRATNYGAAPYANLGRGYRWREVGGGIIRVPNE
jgi:hypothetical protein